MKPADRVRFPDGVLKFDLHRGGNCWSLHLALNQANTGSIPVLGAVARSGAGFQRLTVNEFVAGSIPVGHLVALIQSAVIGQQLTGGVEAIDVRW